MAHFPHPRNKHSIAHQADVRNNCVIVAGLSLLLSLLVIISHTCAGWFKVSFQGKIVDAYYVGGEGITECYLGLLYVEGRLGNKRLRHCKKRKEG